MFTSLISKERTEHRKYTRFDISSAMSDAIPVPACDQKQQNSSIST